MSEEATGHLQPATRTRTVDDHMFSVRHGPRQATFRLQLFTASGLRPVAVATQRTDEGKSLMNAAERYAEAVWTRHFPHDPEPPIWIEYQLLPGAASRFKEVTFTVTGPHQLSSPRWRHLTLEELRRLVGAVVDPDRGEGYVSRVEEAEPQMIYTVVRVAGLPRPEPFREPACMPVGIPGWRRWIRQLFPRHRGRGCCWYHRGDWHRVSATAVRLLVQAQQDGVDLENIGVHVRDQAMAEGLTGWYLEALSTLVSLGDGIAVEQDDDGHDQYLNGQHRAQAMLDAGVRTTVVLRWEEALDQPI
ncbi:hypothetical protein [Frankia sp. CiP3]|uniref:hypothetical protein n=1 Tax=Frankia sp. CiP3 TaxID=2880971 RepID=UPI001EF56584|nr:hypothetical protein [Frankia sp. CiP3]